MKYPLALVTVIILLILGAIGIRYFQSKLFPLPSGETGIFESQESEEQDKVRNQNESPSGTSTQIMQTQRDILITDGVKHSIPLNEILSGGPGKDGIPSIDNPVFISTQEASFLNDTDPGVGLVVEDESRFYPYRILVWHEIVNDTIQGQPVLVTYCPLCATGIVFERVVAGVEQEFGVSGRLWRSNLLMYNRAGDAKSESLWSQVLGEAVLGVNTGEKLAIIPSDIVRWADWKKLHPDTKVLSADTGAERDYGRDPYGDYYTSESVSFGASFQDSRLHPKTLVIGIEINGKYKAYDIEGLKTGETQDMFEGKDVVVSKDSAGRIAVIASGERVPHIPSFWFSWLAVHPETELFK